MYTVYILKTNKNTYYVGQTKDLEKRIEQHKTKKGAKYLRMFDSFELVYEEKLNSRSEALKREIELKKLSKKQKIAIINS